GVNLMPLLLGENKAAPHDTLYWRWRSQAAVLEFPWKLIHLGEHERYLFNVTTPQGELTNLLADHPEIAARLDAKLKTWTASLKPPGPPEPNNDQDNLFFAAHVDKTIAQATKRLPRRSTSSDTRMPDTAIQGWICRNGTLSLQNGSLVLTPDAERTKKSRAFLTHSQLDLHGPATAILKLRATDAGDGKANITWRTASNSFEPHQSASFTWPTQSDWQEVRVAMPETSRIIHLRVVLPAGATRLEIQSIRLQGNDGRFHSFPFATK
ncbi:MAG: hypothetical protein KDA96_27860, partial [Planctomycetaceae bacterium]|nr:hypothetical protein [Planctomycetaceae bacterium]